MKMKPLNVKLLLAFIMMFSTANYSIDAAMTPDGEMIIVPEYVEAEKIVQNGDFKGAIPLLTKTLSLHPSHVSALNLMGFALRRLGQFDKAEKYYEGALLLNPLHIGALNYIGQLFLQTGRPDKAKEMLSRLKSVCEDGCKELDHLQKAVDTGVAGDY
jgi:Flp pilus assembly protein TadD